MLITLATWKAEIRRITVQDQPGEIVQDIPSPKYRAKTDWRCGSTGRVLALQQTHSPEF
jgi:hypothetical protein